MDKHVGQVVYQSAATEPGSELYSVPVAAGDVVYTCPDSVASGGQIIQRSAALGLSEPGKGEVSISEPLPLDCNPFPLVGG